MGGIGRRRVDSAVCRVVIEEVVSCRLKHVVVSLQYLPALFGVLTGCVSRSLCPLGDVQNPPVNLTRFLDGSAQGALEGENGANKIG